MCQASTSSHHHAESRPGNRDGETPGTLNGQELNYSLASELRSLPSQLHDSSNMETSPDGKG